MRYIETSADETVDTNWTVRDNAWRSGDFRYVIRNLTNGDEYDVQVRAVNSAGDGDWSDTETGTPLPDDIPITMQLEDSTIDVDEDGGSVVLTVVFTTTLNAPPEADFTFDVALTFTDVSTTIDDDYTAPPSLSNFVASDFAQTDVNGQQRYQASRDFTVLILDDTVDESNETLRVTVDYLTAGLSHLQGGPKTATITIRDDEHVPVTISWQQADITVDEDDGSVTLRAQAVTTVDKQPEDGFSFDARIHSSNGTAIQPGDYSPVDETLTFNRNDFSRTTISGNRVYRAVKQVTVSIVDDTDDEIEEDFTLTFEYTNSNLLHLQGDAAVATVKITDDEFVPVNLSWDQAEASVDEDSGSVTLLTQATTTEAGAPLSDVSFTVRVFTRAGTAQQTSDFTSLDATETILHTDFGSILVNGDLRYRAEKQITIDIEDDIHDEGDEDFTVVLSYGTPRPPYLQGNSAIATVTIANDDVGGPKPPPPPNTGGGGGGFGPAPVAPKFSDGFRTKRAVAVNASPSDPVGDPVLAVHEDDLEITYSLSGADASLFSVDEETGQIRVNEGVELEMGRTYTMNLTATDSAGFGAIIIVEIEVAEAAHHRYDGNRNGMIERSEVIAAVQDYFDGEISKDDLIELIKLYFAGPS